MKFETKKESRRQAKLLADALGRELPKLMINHIQGLNRDRLNLHRKLSKYERR